VISVTLKNKKKEPKFLKGKSVKHIMFVGSEETAIILQDTLLTGITDVSFGFSTNQESTLLLSNKGINRKINKPQTINCSIKKEYLGRDFLKSLTGFAGLSGQFIYGSNALNFTDAAISSYTISMRANDSPKINVNIKIFGDLSPTTNLRAATAYVDNDIGNLDVDSVSFNFLNKNSAIDNFSFSTNFQVEPTYEIESIKSSNIKILPPISYSTSATIEMTEQEYEDVTGLLESEKYDRAVSLSFTDNKVIEDVQAEEQRFLSFISSGIPLGLDTGLYDIDFPTGFAALDTFSFSKFGLSSQNISISTQDTINLDVSYDGLDLSIPTGTPVPFTSGNQSIINQITANVDEAIADFQAYLDIVKNTGEDFENIATGTGFSNNYYLFNLDKYRQEEDFESEPTGTVTGNLYLLGVNQDSSILEIDEINFESTATGATNENLSLIG
tara:strand:+ start:550 stop:1878 length:1329 start_codon:yes stop_codon:yes gene_type:complete